MKVSGQLHALGALPPGTEPLVLIDWEAGWVLEPILMFLRRKESLDPAGNLNPDCPAHKLVTIISELSKPLI
jgi:hypothetical protein